MLKTTTRILIFALFLSVQANFAHADQKWVEVTVLTGGPATNTAGYTGLIDSTVYDQITKQLVDKGMFQLSSVYWLGNDGKPMKMKDIQTSGIKNGYGDTVYFRQDYVTRIVLLDQAYINSLMADKK